MSREQNRSTRYSQHAALRDPHIIVPAPPGALKNGARVAPLVFAADVPHHHHACSPQPPAYYSCPFPLSLLQLRPAQMGGALTR